MTKPGIRTVAALDINGTEFFFIEKNGEQISEFFDNRWEAIQANSTEYLPQFPNAK